MVLDCLIGNVLDLGLYFGNVLALESGKTFNYIFLKINRMDLGPFKIKALKT